MQVKIKRLSKESKIPKYSKYGDAGLDLTAISKEYDKVNKLFIYDTGIALEIPEGYVGLLFPRSSLCKKSLILSNHVGVVDSGYRGSIKFMYRIATPLSDNEDWQYKIGDRIGQILILPYPKIEFIESENLSTTERGIQGYGSSGN